MLPAAGKGSRDDAGCREAVTMLLAVGRGATTLAARTSTISPGERGHDAAWETDQVHLDMYRIIRSSFSN
jgi:hypothetical protein